MKKILLFLQCILSISLMSAGFRGDTLVKTPRIDLSNGFVPIQNLKIGDNIMCFNGGIFPVKQKIENIRRKTVNNVLKIALGDKNIMHTSLDEKFYILKDKNWVAAEKLFPGDMLLHQDFGQTKIVEIENIQKLTELFDITLGGKHNLGITKNAIIVHDHDLFKSDGFKWVLSENILWKTAYKAFIDESLKLIGKSGAKLLLGKTVIGKDTDQFVNLLINVTKPSFDIVNYACNEEMFFASTGFPGDTLINTVNGFVPIKYLKAGDIVICFKDGYLVTTKAIQNVRKRTAHNVLQITMDDGNIIHVCNDARFYNAREKTWKFAKKFCIGDVFLRHNMNRVKITAVEMIEGPTDVFDITVETHNFGVSKNYVFVPNEALNITMATLSYDADAGATITIAADPISIGGFPGTVSAKLIYQSVFGEINNTSRSQELIHEKNTDKFVDFLINLKKTVIDVKNNIKNYVSTKEDSHDKDNMFSASTGFSGDTLVSTTNGFIPIKDLKIGDIVICFKDGHFLTTKSVLGIRKRSVNSFLKITTNDKNVVYACDDAQFYGANEDVWKFSKNLCVGDTFLQQNMNQVKITAIEKIKKSIDVFDITVEGYHNFGVSKDAISVHNEPITFTLGTISTNPCMGRTILVSSPGTSPLDSSQDSNSKETVRSIIKETVDGVGFVARKTAETLGSAIKAVVDNLPYIDEWRNLRVDYWQALSDTRDDIKDFLHIPTFTTGNLNETGDLDQLKHDIKSFSSIVSEMWPRDTNKQSCSNFVSHDGSRNVNVDQAKKNIQTILDNSQKQNQETIFNNTYNYDMDNLGYAEIERRKHVQKIIDMRNRKCSEEVIEGYCSFFQIDQNGSFVSHETRANNNFEKMRNMGLKESRDYREKWSLLENGWPKSMATSHRLDDKDFLNKTKQDLLNDGFIEVSRTEFISGDYDYTYRDGKKFVKKNLSVSENNNENLLSRENKKKPNQNKKSETVAAAGGGGPGDPNDPNNNKKNKDGGKKDKYTYKNGRYEDAGYHHAQSVGNGKNGKSPSPIDGQLGLDQSIEMSAKSGSRLGVGNGQIIVFSKTSSGEFHGHVVGLEEFLSAEKFHGMLKKMVKAGLMDNKGNIVKSSLLIGGLSLIDTSLQAVDESNLKTNESIKTELTSETEVDEKSSKKNITLDEMIDNQIKDKKDVVKKVDSSKNVAETSNKNDKNILIIDESNKVDSHKIKVKSNQDLSNSTSEADDKKNIGFEFNVNFNDSENKKLYSESTSNTDSKINEDNNSKTELPSKKITLKEFYSELNKKNENILQFGGECERENFKLTIPKIVKDVSSNESNKTTQSTENPVDKTDMKSKESTADEQSLKKEEEEEKKASESNKTDVAVKNEKPKTETSNNKVTAKKKAEDINKMLSNLNNLGKKNSNKYTIDFLLKSKYLEKTKKQEVEKFVFRIKKAEEDVSAH